MASGRPDWYSSVAMHGKHLNDYITVAVDVLGNMLGIMQGQYGGLLKTVATDTDGVIQALLTTGIVGVESSSVIIAADSEVSIFNIAGKGMVYGGMIYTTEGPAQLGIVGKVKIVLDGIDLGWQNAPEMVDYGETNGNGFPLTLICKRCYEEGGHTRWNLMNELKFKATCDFRIHNLMTVARTYYWNILKVTI